MKNRKFLVPIAALAATFTGEQAVASVSDAPSSLDRNDAKEMQNATPSENITMKKNDDTFNFVLKRNEGGKLMAWHSSHGSHGSHGSHTSHTSSHY